MRYLIFAPLTLAAGLAACATSTTSAQALPDDVARAAFRHVIESNAASPSARTSIRCLGVGQRPRLRDPSPGVLRSAADAGPAVVPASTCRAGERAATESGQPAVIYTVDPVRCEADTCVVRAGYYEGNLSASTSELTLRRSGGTWTVDPFATVPGPVS